MADFDYFASHRENPGTMRTALASGIGKSREQLRNIVGDGAPGQTVEQRLMAAGKRLFASQGFENTTTSAIVREAGTSESQLIKYFGNKEGLLLRIFENGWQRMNFMYAAAAVSNSPLEGLRMIFELVVRVLTEDRELRDLMLFEGRRIRGKNSDVLVTSGYRRLCEEVSRILETILQGNPLLHQVRPKALTSALIGMLESMLRDQAVTERKTGQQDPTPDEIRAMFRIFMSGVAKAAAKELA
jgi:AcrR family transcriptional regulator